MQCAIDNAKRQFDIDLNGEIKRIKKDLDVQTIGYPKFWLLIHPEFNRENINYKLNCPMNYMSSLDLTKFRSDTSTLPMEHFFVKHSVTKDAKKKNRNVEELIVNYSLGLYNYNSSTEDSDDDYLVLRDDFEEMIKDIQRMYISSTYQGLFSWIIDRAFLITNRTKANKEKISLVNKNRSLLFKTLYTVNKKAFLNCFKNGNFDTP